MPLEPPTTPIAARELSLTRVIDAPAELLFRAWTEPALIVRWFTPEPWTTVSAQTDPRPGGSSLIVMRSPAPDSRDFPNRGVYLEVVKNRRLVFTDAFVHAWEPSCKAFMVGTITFDDLGGRTRYSARVQHWSAEDRDAHEKMGFHPGWGKATDQLAALVATL